MFTLTPVKRNLKTDQRNLRMKGVKPSSSTGSHNSFIKPLASSLESFSPKIKIENQNLEIVFEFPAIFYRAFCFVKKVNKPAKNRE